MDEQINLQDIVITEDNIWAYILLMPLMFPEEFQKRYAELAEKECAATKVDGDDLPWSLYLHTSSPQELQELWNKKSAR